MFHFVLNPGGFLFLGSAESVGNIARHFSAISKRWRVFSHQPIEPRRPPVLPISAGLGLRRSAGGGEVAIELGALAGQERFYQQLLQAHGPTQVLINARYEVLFVSGDVSPYLVVPIGQASHDLFKMVRPGLAMALRSAVNGAQHSRAKMAVNTTMADPADMDAKLAVRIEVTPVPAADRQELLLVSFALEAGSRMTLSLPGAVGDDWVLQQLLQELNATREDLQRTIEQSRISNEEMRAANEEVMTVNEELQSANEELESSKEELQSLNEELVGSNALLDAKVLEVGTLNTDLNNLLNSIQTATLLVDEQLKIRRFTSACTQLMRIIPSDIGRSIDDVVRMIDDPGLSNDCLSVMRGTPVPDKEVSDADDHWYLRRINSYVEPDGHAVGVVLTFPDITIIKQADRLLRERTELLQWQSNLLSQAAPVIGRDLDDRIVFWNKSAEYLYGWPEAEVLGKVSHDLLRTRFPLPLKRIQAYLEEHDAWTGELTHLRRDGLEVIVDSQWTTYRNEAGEAQAIVEVNNDVTERQRAREALRGTESMFHTMVDWTYNWEYWIGPEGKFIYMTPSVERLSGYRREDFEQNPGLIDAIVHPDDREIWRSHVHALTVNQRSESSGVELRIIRKNGSVCWVNHICRPVFDEMGQYLGRRVTVRDISEQKQAEQQIHNLAYFDPLTQLPNRRLFTDRLGQALVASKRSQRFGAVMVLDLDHFKSLNDTQGHDIGDLLLVEVAKRLLACVRAQDTVSRLGGDEFVVLLGGLETSESESAVDAEVIAEKIRLEISKPYLLGVGGNEYFSMTSIGVTLFRGQDDSADLLLKQADVALYEAKGAGRNLVRFFNPAMQAEIDLRINLESSLRRALDNHEFKLFFQPQVDQGGKVIGVEALIRWLDPDGNMVPPADFIPVAENSGLIIQIGHWVLDTACAQLKAWESEPDFSDLVLSVNVSARQFHQPDFVVQVRNSIVGTDIDPGRLRLELTESVVLDGVARVAERMNELIGLGVSFSLDDFGTGYSSLSYLKLLPMSEVKIDRSFVRDVTVDPSDAAIVRAILAMSETLGLRVIAEGVETPAQRDFLFENGCRVFQGDLFGIPVPIEQWG